MDKKSFVAVSAIWYERYLECSRVQGTEAFTKSVWRFYHSLLNLGEDKLAIRDKVKEYCNKTWRPTLKLKSELECKQSNISPYNVASRDVTYGQVENEIIIDLFEFIIQTIQDSGCGWPTPKEMETFTYNLE